MEYTIQQRHLLVKRVSAPEWSTKCLTAEESNEGLQKIYTYFQTVFELHNDFQGRRLFKGTYLTSA